MEMRLLTKKDGSNTQTNIVEKYFGILKGTEKDADDWKKRRREERTKADIAFSKKQKKLWSALQ